MEPLCACPRVHPLLQYLVTAPVPCPRVQIAEAALTAFERDAPHSAAALDLMPKALSMLHALAAQPGPAAASADGLVDSYGSDVCSGLVSRVLQHPWPPASTTRVLLALRSFPLTMEELQEAVGAAARRAKAAEPGDLPAIVHQLLVLSARGSRDAVWQVRSQQCPRPRH